MDALVRITGAVGNNPICKLDVIQSMRQQIFYRADDRIAVLMEYYLIGIMDIDDAGVRVAADCNLAVTCHHWLVKKQLNTTPGRSAVVHSKEN